MQPSSSEREEMTVPLYVVLIISLCLLLLIGMVNNHPNPEGRPLLLLPDVWQALNYQQRAGEWSRDFQDLERSLTGLVSTNQVGDLLSQTQAAQGAFERAVALTREIDQVPAPVATSGLREMLSNTALAYLEASRSALRWLNVPKEEIRNEALTKLQEAQVSRKELEESEWIKAR
ncbi:MAG: hypothetical protein GYA58_11305 [Anaerolineaceae bacterium]|nr:hypothetical protein [Anaerolineaceae bacterium]